MTLVERLRELAQYEHDHGSIRSAISRDLLLEAADALEAHEQDAVRYRWIRDRRGYVTYANPDTCDAVIDAAIKGKP